MFKPARSRTLQLTGLLAAMVVTTTLSAQDAVQPAAAASAQPDSQQAPLMQLEADAERVVMPPPSAAPKEATPAPVPEPALPAELPACRPRAEPSPCTQPADAYQHDGFYLRFSTETDYLAVVGEGPDGSVSVKGLASGGTLAVGGTPVRGLVVAGVLGSAMLRGNLKGGAEDADERVSMARIQLGALADWYPDPSAGWHVGAALGLGALALTEASVPDAVGAAFSARVFGGYDFWIGPQWSLGLAATLTANTSSTLRDREGDKIGYRFYLLSAGVAWSLTLH